MTQKIFKSELWEFFTKSGENLYVLVSASPLWDCCWVSVVQSPAPSTITSFPFWAANLTQLTFGFTVAMVGGFVFTYLPLMFAMAIPMGLAKRNKAVAAFAGFVGSMLMNMSINYYLTATHQLAGPRHHETGRTIDRAGIQTLEMGVLGGIVVWVITHFLHDRFQDTVLHDAFASLAASFCADLLPRLTLSLVGLFIPMLGNTSRWASRALGISSRAPAFRPLPLRRRRAV